METIRLSVRIWGIAQLIFNGLCIVLSAFSLIPLMLVPALAGGTCSLFLFLVLFHLILYVTTRRNTMLLLTAIAILISCFVPLYGYSFIQTGRILIWDNHSGVYAATLIAAGCGMLSMLLHQRALFRMHYQCHLSMMTNH